MNEVNLAQNELQIPDLYFKPEYGKLYEDIDRGKCEIFEYNSKLGIVRNMFIKRPVPWLVDDEQYYDIVTPYGYGGPIINKCNADQSILINAFWDVYLEYCRKQKIVAEFVRFHPLIGNALNWSEKYEVIYNRHTVAIDLTDSDYQMSQFTQNCRNRIRKAIKNEITIEIDETFMNLGTFLKLYYLTMQKDNASKYYYFPIDYFYKIKNIINEKSILIHAIYNKEIIASSLFILSGVYMHHHLSATKPEYYSLSSNNLIISSAVEYGQNHGCHWLHLGGGLTESEEDSLLKFKRTFARTNENLKDFYIGKKVYNPSIYQLLANKVYLNNAYDKNYFPIYRCKN